MRSTVPSATHRRATLLVLVALLFGTVLVSVPQDVRAAGTVGNGTPGSCSDAVFTQALQGGGTVTFRCPGQFLTVTEKTIAADTIIVGNGVFLSGNTTNRLFSVNSGKSLTLQTITLTGGASGTQPGGAIRNNGGTLSLDGVTVMSSTGASGGGIASIGGTVTITNSTLAQNIAMSGGNLSLDGATATITNSTVAVGIARNGYGSGGINARNSAVTISGSTIGGNIANYGAGIYLEGGTLNLSNSTVSSNQEPQDTLNGIGSGLYNIGGVATLNQVTLAANTAGGIEHGSRAGTQTRLANSIVAGNTRSGGTPSDCVGTLESQGYNLIGSTSGCPITGVTEGNITGQDPKLLTMRRNGGLTNTHPLDTNSPALDTGNPATSPPVGQVACLAIDQRGINRPQHGRCDMGAYESRRTTVGDGATDSCTVAAYDAAMSGFDVVTFACPSTLMLVGEKTITRTLILDTDPDACCSGPVLSGNGANRLFNVKSGANLIVRGLELTSGISTGQGGLIFNAGLLTVSDSELLSGIAVDGGALANEGTALIERSTVAENETYHSGGAIKQLRGSLTIADTNINGNRATRFSSLVVPGPGGGIHVTGGTVVIRDSALTDNESYRAGGGLSVDGGQGTSVTVLNSTIAGNQTLASSLDGPGGGVALTGGALRLNNVTVARNRSGDAGGGLSIADGTAAQVANSLIADNTHGASPNDCAATDAGGFVSDGYNLIETTSGCHIAGDVTGNVTGQDPQLAASHGDFGGHALSLPASPTSPARNAGNPATPGSSESACLAADQRGVTRPQDGRCDIGATEREGNPPILTRTVTPAANAAGWHRSDVTVVYTMEDGDGESGLQECRTVVNVDAGDAPTSNSADDQVTCTSMFRLTIDAIAEVSVSATDHDGNEVSDEITVRLDRTAPTMTTAPSQRFVRNTTVPQTTVPVTVFGWSGIDVNGDIASGLKRYRLQQQIEGTNPVDVRLSRSLATSAVRQLAPDANYMFQATAVDVADNTGAFLPGDAFTATVQEDNHGEIDYSTGWTESTPTFAHGGTLRSATAADSQATYTFSGTNIAWVSTKGTNRGRAEVSIDGGPATVIGLHAASLLTRQMVFVKNDLSPGTHTITIKVLAPSEPNGPTRVDLDAFLVLAPSD